MFPRLGGIKYKNVGHMILTIAFGVIHRPLYSLEYLLGPIYHIKMIYLLSTVQKLWRESPNYKKTGHVTTVTPPLGSFIFCCIVLAVAYLIKRKNEVSIALAIQKLRSLGVPKF